MGLDVADRCFSTQIDRRDIGKLDGLSLVTADWQRMSTSRASLTGLANDMLPQRAQRAENGISSLMFPSF